MNVSQRERELWLLDQRINARGFQVDTELARAAMDACWVEKQTLDTKVSALSLGAINSATQREKLRQMLAGCGVSLPNMQAGTLDAALDRDDLKGVARELLEARQRVSKASTAKYKRILDSVGPDGRLRGALQFAGAMRTARWAGRIFQPHNMPRPKRKGPEILEAVAALKAGIADLLTDNVHQMCSDVLRSLIIAAPGKTLLVGDWKAIEGRFGAWLADEEWKLRVYEENGDIYIATYNKMFGQAEDTRITDNQRQEGKCFELSMQYEGGVGALVTSAKTYGVNLKKLGAGAWAVADKKIRDRAKMLHGFALTRSDPLAHRDQKLYTQLEAAKLMWRSTSPMTVRLWRIYKKAAWLAVQRPGKKFKAGKCIFYCKGGFLIIRLPSGRSILYAKPLIHMNRDGEEVLSYMASYGGRQYLYGGKILENVDQAGSRDILAAKLLQMDEAGYPIVLHVHDEIIAEVEKSGPLTLGAMFEIMESPLPWAPGLPLKAEGYEADRYRKD